MYKIGMTSARAYWMGFVYPKVTLRVMHANLHGQSPSSNMYSAMVF